MRKKRFVVFILAVLLCMVILPSGVKAEEGTGLSDFSNTLTSMPVYGEVCNSYLEETDGGYQAVLADEQIHIIEFDSNWNQVSEKTMDFELPIFGAYYSGEHYNYMVFGQAGNQAGAEIYRVVKYDKDFQRIAALSVPYEDCFTVHPFGFGNVSVAESGNELTVYTARERPDGHQSNIAIRVDTDTMTVSDASGMSQFPNVHVSHSFRQIVKYDGSMPILADLGDAYPRAVCLQQSPGSITHMLDIEGQIGDNLTRTDVSGLAVSDTGYLVVGTQINGDCENVYLSYVEKGQEQAELTWLTNYASYQYGNVRNAKIIQVSDGVFAVMWNCFDNGGGVNYVMVDDRGKTISELKTVEGAELTECEPILENGKVTWLKYEDGQREVCSLTDFSCGGIYEGSEDTYVSASDAWDGSADTGWYSGGKSEFTLNTPEQLAGLSELVNGGNTFEGKKILLGKDMFFNEDRSYQRAWTPIAAMSGETAFEGTFDGQGHILYNIYIEEGGDGGLFGRIGEKGIVKAVEIAQGLLETGAVAYENSGWILFCENRSMVSSGGIVDGAGGICYENRGMIYGCGNKGMILSAGDAGGIAARNTGNGSSIDSCWNQGYVAGTGFSAAGIVSSNWGWVFDCYNAGVVSGSLSMNYAKTVAGIVGENHSQTSATIYNCYNSGHLDIDEEWNWYNNDTICGGAPNKLKNVYSTPSKYNKNAEVLTKEELRTAQAVEKLLAGNAIQKWRIDKDGVNAGQIIPAAQQDMEDGVYKMLPDVGESVKEVSIRLSDKGYELRPFRTAYYGVKEAVPVYHSDSELLSITEDGIITPKKTGTAVVRVTFEEGEHAKETGFDVTVTITGMRGDVTGDDAVDIRDLRLILRSVCKKAELTEQQSAAGDVTDDGTVDIRDLRKVLRYVCHKITEL